MTALDQETAEALDPTLALRRKAKQVKKLKNVNLPRLSAWNYDPCEHHEQAQPDCAYRECGGDFFDHQRVTISWLYLNGSGMVASVPGAGKTNIALGLLALLKERKELRGRAIIVVQTPVVLQWIAEAQRFAPGLRVAGVYSGMPKPKRVNTYVRPWDVLIVGFHMLMQDVDMLTRLEPTVVITDDVDPLLNHDNRTHESIVALSQSAERVVIMNASNLQTRLQQLHAAMEPMGGREVWGSVERFEARYLRYSNVTTYTGKGRKMKTVKSVGYRNIRELKSKLYPWVIRHGYEDMTDVRMPALMPPENVWLELHPAQRKKYQELRKGVLRLQTEQGEKVKKTTALTMITYGQMICAGLPALGEEDGPNASSKLDWIMDKVDGGAWHDRKIVCFIKNPGLIKALQARLDEAGIGHAVVWGKNKDAAARQAERSRFWNDPNCRVFMGTSAMERGLNLQAANIIVNVDTLLNPERMKQIAGRVRRAGSVHDHVWIFNLLCVDTQEEGYLDVLRRREALVSHVWGEKQELYEELSPLELLQLITD